MNAALVVSFCFNVQFKVYAEILKGFFFFQDLKVNVVSFQVSASLFRLVLVLLLIPGHASLTKVKHGNTSGRISDNC